MLRPQAGLRLVIVAALLFGTPALCEKSKAPPEPRLLSVFPLGDRPGSDYHAVIRGITLQDTQAIWFDSDYIHAHVDRAGRDPESDPNAATPADTVDIRVIIDSVAKPGSYLFRAVTKQGVSNAIFMRVTDCRTILEPDTLTSNPSQAPRLSDFPLIVNGRIAKKGELDYYALDAEPGQELTFQVVSGFSAFDPSVAILKPSGSWFDPHRLNRVAFNDEPLYYPDFSSDALLVHRFVQGGPYLVSIASFEDRGSANHVYQLRISIGRVPTPLLRALPKPGWQEHTFTRRLTADWLEQLSRRGDPLQSKEPLASYRAVEASAASPPVMKVPGIVEGNISQPGETQKITFRLKEAQELAFEVETPEATAPLFNPVVRVLDSTGRELVTNIYTQLNNCGGFMMKTAQPKTVASFQADHEYTLEVHDITTDSAGSGFAYRVLVRPLAPHVGKVTLEQERVNLKPGAAKPLNVELEREENYSGLVALTVEGLPSGVQSVAGSEPEEGKPPLMNGGKVDRYFPKKQKSILLLTAAPDAPVTSMPQMARVLVHPIVEGRMAAPVATELVPVMVVAATADAPAGKP
jgi:hypothetical protein